MMVSVRARVSLLVIAAALLASFALYQFGGRDGNVSRSERLEILKRAQVWAPNKVELLDIKAGPAGPGSFALNETVRCDFIERDFTGSLRKFSCAIPGHPEDKLKVKYGADNPEVYGEVLASRLLSVLGFGADRMYPVRVICRGCPASIEAESRLSSGEAVLDPAVIERKAEGLEIESHRDQGWSWPELDLVDPEAGGAPPAHRDALKLLMVMMQHGDNKAEQQRLVCLDEEQPGATPNACRRPFLLVHDVGLTFGRAAMLVRADHHVSLSRWAETPIWNDGNKCRGTLEGTFLASMERPLVGEAGRAFLAQLLNRLRDQQLRDLFEVARVTRRTVDNTPIATVDDWIAAFKNKRAEISDRRCQ